MSSNSCDNMEICLVVELMSSLQYIIYIYNIYIYIYIYIYSL
jgi:hypothetical protein